MADQSIIDRFAELEHAGGGYAFTDAKALIERIAEERELPVATVREVMLNHWDMRASG